MSFIYIVTGYGRLGECFGEFAQAEASALFMKEKKNAIFFITRNKRLIDIINSYGFQAFYSDNTGITQKIISKIKPDAIFLCNSKTNYMYEISIMRKPPLEPKPFICSLDSNWLFLEDKRIGFPAPPWINRIYIAFPKKIYEMGLKENGGHYIISDSFKDKIICPGFIPSSISFSKNEKELRRKELNIKDDEKLIAVYFGLSENDILPQFLPKFSLIIEELIQNGYKIKVWFKGKTKIQKKWIKCISWVDTTRLFDLTMASADLVIQHHGMGNLPKIIHNQVPVICFVFKYKKELRYYRHLAEYEVDPFSKLNLCRSLSYSVSFKELKQTVMDLLYNAKEIEKMKKAQEMYFQPGEENQYNDLLKCLEIHNKK